MSMLLTRTSGSDVVQSAHEPSLESSLGAILGIYGVARRIDQIGTPEEVAGLVTLLLRDDSRFISGSQYLIDGGRAC